MKDIIENPDIIFIQNDMKDTLWIVKKINKNVKITIKLNTIKYGNKNYKNSIIQMQYMNDKELNRNMLNGKVKILWQKPVDNKIKV